MKRYAPWEKAFNKIATPFEHFIHAQTTTGMILMFMTLLALILANTPLTESYAHFFHTKIDFNVGSWQLSHTLHHWINDGLMAIFFFLIGLEIKREVLVGELSNLKVAILPVGDKWITDDPKYSVNLGYVDTINTQSVGLYNIKSNATTSQKVKLEDQAYLK